MQDFNPKAGQFYKATFNEKWSGQRSGIIQIKDVFDVNGVECFDFKWVKKDASDVEYEADAAKFKKDIVVIRSQVAHKSDVKKAALLIQDTFYGLLLPPDEVPQDHRCTPDKNI